MSEGNKCGNCANTVGCERRNEASACADGLGISVRITSCDLWKKKIENLSIEGFKDMNGRTILKFTPEYWTELGVPAISVNPVLMGISKPEESIKGILSIKDKILKYLQTPREALKKKDMIKFLGVLTCNLSSVAGDLKKKRILEKGNYLP